ncbi:hypothetical protein GLW08_11355 [Pontibacillus yanchengensis]|uniref:Uncharacterized protein n=1 Tax=Pontibacillus yanchengensis TaxID=462910 RepID=A0ACC7VJ08_9BACI|nr:hypothetical protein [Pontibacillus yanchengensis]MYL53934.1 hypothetical protein [Pontibacillus yanchengensis]
MYILYGLLFLIPFILVFVIGNFISVSYKIKDSQLIFSQYFGVNTNYLLIQNIKEIYEVDWGNVPKNAIQIGNPGRYYSGLVFVMNSGQQYLVHIGNCGKLLDKLKTTNPDIRMNISKTFLY